VARGQACAEYACRLCMSELRCFAEVAKREPRVGGPAVAVAIRPPERVQRSSMALLRSTVEQLNRAARVLCGALTVAECFREMVLRIGIATVSSWFEPSNRARGISGHTLPLEVADCQVVLRVRLAALSAPQVMRYRNALEPRFSTLVVLLFGEVLIVGAELKVRMGIA